MRAMMMLAMMCAVSARAQQIPIRQLGPAEATASEKINAVAIVRPLSDGRVVVAASTLLDYYPPLRDGAARSDADGNLWILPTTSSSARGGLLYDVVNRKGEIVERVQLPPGCALAGLGTNRVVYLTCIATSLERRRVVN